jgi:hypothetical protein
MGRTPPLERWAVSDVISLLASSVRAMTRNDVSTKPRQVQGLSSCSSISMFRGNFPECQDQLTAHDVALRLK